MKSNKIILMTIAKKILIMIHSIQSMIALHIPIIMGLVEVQEEADLVDIIYPAEAAEAVEVVEAVQVLVGGIIQIIEDMIIIAMMRKIMIGIKIAIVTVKL